MDSSILWRYKEWLQSKSADLATRTELSNIAGNLTEIEDRFYKELDFGTAGLRGKMGAGTNRINWYTVRRATQGLAQVIKAQVSKGKERGVVIAYDTRKNSREFALQAARVLTANGIKAYVFKECRPTPELSFAVRHLRAAAGVVITASHNPPDYNGYKVYGEDGCQILADTANEIVQHIQAIPSYFEVPLMREVDATSKGLLSFIGQDIDVAYFQAVMQQSLNRDMIAEHGAKLAIVYTSLHGTGVNCVPDILQGLGFSQLSLVDEQCLTDPTFPTINYPNPEDKAAFALALQQAEDTGADVVMATDPDADRIGITVKHEDQFVFLNGNQTGALLLEYILGALKDQGVLPRQAAVVKSLVSSNLGSKVAAHYGVKVFNTLTGFKYIGQKITQFEASGSHKFIFGYEESYGYLAGTYARDKDAVVAAALIAEMALHYKLQGQSLYDVLLKLYENYGYFKEELVTRRFEGAQGQEIMSGLIDELRSNPPKYLGGLKVTEVRDYLTQTNTDPTLPPANMLFYMLADSSWVCVRPSGTEPKIKFYLAVNDQTEAGAEHKLAALTQDVTTMLDAYISPQQEVAAGKNKN